MNIPKIAFLVSIGLAVFLYGVAAGVYELFPYSVLRSAQDAVTQVYEERFTLTGTRPVHFLNTARNPGDGVTRLDAARAAPGLTLVSGFFRESSEVRLLRLDGSVVQRWPVRFYDVFPTPQHVQPPNRVPATNWNTDIHGVLALADGSVLFNFEYGGLVKLDRCGNVAWTVPRMTHHSIERSSDGGFWVPARRYVETAPSAFPPIPVPYYEDTILHVSAGGEVLSEISVSELLFQNDLGGLLLANNGPEYLNGVPDLGHLNDIEELSQAATDRFSQFSAGDLLLSLRNLNLVLVVEPATALVKWHQVGPWIRQHDPDFQANGTITVFNNNSDGTSLGNVLGGSTIVAMDPVGRASNVLYGKSPAQKMFTTIRGKHQVLPNGNILITEFAAGRIFEVDSGGDVVWEFINRFDEKDIAEVSQAIRYPDDFFTVDSWVCN